MFDVQPTVPLVTLGYPSAKEDEALRLTDKAAVERDLTPQQPARVGASSPPTRG